MIVTSLPPPKKKKDCDSIALNHNEIEKKKKFIVSCLSFI